MAKDYFPPNADKAWDKMSKWMSLTAGFGLLDVIYALIVRVYMHYPHWIYGWFVILVAIFIGIYFMIFYLVRYLHFYRKQL